MLLTRCLMFSLATLALVEPLMAAEAVGLDLFTSGVDGYASYRIPGLIVTSRGSLLAYCEARKQGKSDWGQIDIVQRRSTNGGVTWSPMQRTVNLKVRVPRNPAAVRQNLGVEGEVTINNPVAIASRNGVVHLLFCAEYSRCFYQRSEDDGVTWSEPVDITAALEKLRGVYDWQVLATGPGHGIELQNGRLVVPVWLSLGTGGHAHRPSVVTTIYSDDQGKSWHAGEIAVPNTDQWVNPNETAAVELADGRVMLNVRSESAAHRRLITVSPNGASGWSSPEFDDDLLESICFGTLVRAPSPEHADTLVFANPRSLERRDGRTDPGRPRDRQNLALHLSRDCGATWPEVRTLDAGPAAYSDLAVLPNGDIACLYERGSYKWLTFVRVPVAWIETPRP